MRPSIQVMQQADQTTSVLQYMQYMQYTQYLQYMLLRPTFISVSVSLAFFCSAALQTLTEREDAEAREKERARQADEVYTHAAVNTQAV